VEGEGGIVLGCYSDPLGKNPLILAILPVDSIEPTPFQRDLSQAHHRRLADVIDRTGLFLDPVIAWQILALNTEKAHNLRERALEVIRIYRGLIDEDGARPESQFTFYLEEAALVTLGVCYERNPKFAGASYNPIVRRLVSFSNEPLAKVIRAHEKQAEMLLELDERVTAVIARLKARGFVSPYLRAFVIARINPLRWIKGEPPPLEEVLKTMRERAGKFNTDKVKQEDLAGTGGAPDEQD
jgi:ParB family chromosome partitioning protein